MSRLRTQMDHWTQVRDLRLQHLHQQRFHCSALNSDQYLNCHWTNWTMCLPLGHGDHAPSHRRHFMLSLNHFRQCTITAAQAVAIQALLGSCTFFWAELKSALTHFVSFTVQEKVGMLAFKSSAASFSCHSGLGFVFKGFVWKHVLLLSC